MGDTDLELAWDTTGYAYTNDIDQMFRIPTDQDEGYGAEAELDTQYITATGLGLNTFVFYIDGTNDDYFSGLVEDIIVLDAPPSVVSISYGADDAVNDYLSSDCGVICPDSDRYPKD